MNIKKLFPEKKGARKSLVEFLEKKGFYVVLILCIVIVGITAVFITTYNITPSNTGFDARNIIPEEVDVKNTAGTDMKLPVQSSIDLSSVAVAQKEEKPAAGMKPNAGEASKPAGPLVAATSEKKPSAPQVDQTKALKLSAPVFGEVTFEYAQDKLVYSKTLEEWRTHSGLDLAADRGSQVKAAADGVVSEIKNDPRFGATLIIDHQNGLKTVYSNLAKTDMVAPNQRIKQGEVIGSVGNTATFETAEQSHLHFEVLKANNPVNPSDYLAKK